MTTYWLLGEIDKNGKLINVPSIHHQNQLTRQNHVEIKETNI